MNANDGRDFIGSRKLFSVILLLLFSILTTSISFAEDSLERGRRLFNEGKYTEAVEVLTSYSQSIEGVGAEAKRYAEANYLLARIYFDAGEDAKVEEYLRKALDADRNIGCDEAVKSFKEKVEKLRASLPDLGLKAGDVKKIMVNGVEFELVWIPPGDFLMGSPSWEPGRTEFEGPQHRVKISKGFWLGKYEVTQGQWQALTGSNPSAFKNAGSNAPVEQVSWAAVQEFIRILNASARGGFRLPTEAEWEYACRAGTGSPIYTGGLTIISDHNGPELDFIAWYTGNSGVDYKGGVDSSKWHQKQYKHRYAGTHPVGRKQPNAWGLHDMLGNVCEWCQDWFGNYDSGDQVDPVGPSSGTHRVFRGSNWGGDAQTVRAAFRAGLEPGYPIYALGFRLVRVQ